MWQAKRKHDAVASPEPPNDPPPLEPVHGRPPATVEELNRQLHPPAPTATSTHDGNAIRIDMDRTGPLDGQERTVLASLLRRQFEPETPPKIVNVQPPSGHDLTIAYLPKPRKGSADAKKSTVGAQSVGGGRVVDDCRSGYSRSE